MPRPIPIHRVDGPLMVFGGPYSNLEATWAVLDEATRLLANQHAIWRYRPDGTNHPETDGTSFTFLGFAHIWGKSRVGKNVVRQVTAKNRYARAPTPAIPPRQPLLPDPLDLIGVPA
jgi:hypothetical protein